MVCKQFVTKCTHLAAELDLCSVNTSMIVFGWTRSDSLRNEILVRRDVIYMEGIRRAHVPVLVPHGILVAVFCVCLLKVIDCLLRNRHFVVSFSDQHASVFDLQVYLGADGTEIFIETFLATERSVWVKGVKRFTVNLVTPGHHSVHDQSLSILSSRCFWHFGQYCALLEL